MQGLGSGGRVEGLINASDSELRTLTPPNFALGFSGSGSGFLVMSLYDVRTPRGFMGSSL